MSLLLRPQAVAWQTTFISLMALILIIFAPYATPQNVTLTSFTVTSLLGQPEIYVEWKTAAEFDTVVFCGAQRLCAGTVRPRQRFHST